MRTVEEIKKEANDLIEEDTKVLDKINKYNDRQTLSCHIDENGNKAGDLIEFKELYEKHTENTKKIDELMEELGKAVQTRIIDNLNNG